MQRHSHWQLSSYFVMTVSLSNVLTRRPLCVTPYTLSIFQLWITSSGIHWRFPTVQGFVANFPIVKRTFLCVSMSLTVLGAAANRRYLEASCLHWQVCVNRCSVVQRLYSLPSTKNYRLSEEYLQGAQQCRFVLLELPCRSTVIGNCPLISL